MKKRTQCFIAAALFFTASLIVYFYPQPDYTSLQSIQGVVEKSYIKSIYSGKGSIRYRAVELKSDTMRNTVYIEPIRQAGKIEISDNVSVKGTSGGVNIIHAWELNVNDKPIITFEEFKKYDQKDDGIVLLFGLALTVALTVAGIFSREKRSR